MNQLIAPVLRPVQRWAEHYQRGACRNAMVASTMLAERRRERVEVADYLERALSRDSHRAGPASPSLPVARLG